MSDSNLDILNSLPVLVLSTGYEPLFKTNWKRAMTAICAGRAEIVESREDISIRTGKEIFAFPIKVRFLSGVIAAKIGKISKCPRPTKKNLWIRDCGKCQYCEKKISLSDCTIDHVIPRSRGGIHSWKNIVLSCAKCNQKKGASLLHEISMNYIKAPWVPKGPAFMPDFVKNFHKSQ